MVKIENSMDKYLVLEHLMMQADEQDDEYLADALRDCMDIIWYRLTDVDHQYLNQREMRLECQTSLMNESLLSQPKK